MAGIFKGKHQKLYKKVRVPKDSSGFHIAEKQRTPFRSAGGNLFLNRLFYEQCHLSNDYSSCLFTTGDEHFVLEDVIAPGEVPVYSFKQLYLDVSDPTGYEFAARYLENYEHLMRLKRSGSFREFINRVEEELSVKMISAGIKEIAGLASKGNYNASKYLADAGFAPTKRGRPGKDEVERERKIQAKAKDDVMRDAERLGLKRVK